MARWKINSKSYLRATQFGEPTQWVREETNRETGRAFRKTYDVPLYIDPDDPGVRNREGFCVISTEKTAHPGDLIFIGEALPTPDMEPIDDEARAIHAKWEKQWVNPIDGLPLGNESLEASMIRALERKINDLAAGTPVPTASSEMEDLKRMLAAQQAQIAQLIVGSRPTAEAPLENIDPDASRVPPPIKGSSQARRT